MANIMRVTKSISLVLGLLQVQAELISGKTLQESSQSVKTPEGPQADLGAQKVLIPKFGEVPTNRVLPVDHLTESDYEDINDSDNEVNDHAGDREFCRRIMKTEFLKKLRKMRQARQKEEEADTGSGSTLNEYLDFDPAQAIRPLLDIMGSAARGNATAVDDSYRQLPTYLKTQVNDFIQVFNALITGVELSPLTSP